MKWQASLAQSLGGRVVQEDSAGYGFDDTAEYGYAVVADGLGGHEAGELASAAVTAVAAELWHEDRGHPSIVDGRRFLEDLVGEGHRRVLALNEERRLDARTTICCAFVSRDRVVLANVGDSRVYRVAGSRLERLSRDHTVAEMLVAQGKMSIDDVRGHPDSSLLTQALGGPENPRPHFAELPRAAPGDRLLLCSDGLWQALAPHSAARMSRARPDPAARLASAAVEATGASGDNVTALVLWAGDSPVELWLSRLGLR